MREGATVNYYVLNTGAKIPAIGLGTWQCGGDICIEAVETALKVGYRHLDCAHLYGNEAEVGKALAKAFDGGIKREDVFLTSKLYCATNSHKRVENSVSFSLKSLGVSYLDLYLVHWPESSAFGDATDPPWKSGSEYRQFLHQLKPTWRAMEDLVEMGLVRAIGVSNFSLQQISELLQFAKIVPAVNQVCSWGGYTFIINLIPMHVLLCIVIGGNSSRLYIAYAPFVVLGTLLASLVPVVDFNAVIKDLLVLRRMISNSMLMFTGNTYTAAMLLLT